MDPRAALAPALALALLHVIQQASGLDVHLTELTIYNTHDRFRKPDVYFKCEGERRTQMLTDVKEANKKYTWGDMVVTTLAADGCRSCGFYEKDYTIFDEDDTFGRFSLCASDFLHSGGHLQLLKEGEFLSLFRCADCVPPPPPPAMPPLPPPAPPPPMMIPLSEVPSAGMWRFVSTGWAHEASTDDGHDFTWAILESAVYASESCAGQPIAVDSIEYTKCCGKGPWAPTEAESDGLSSEDSGDSESSDFAVDADDDGGEGTSWSPDAWRDDPEDWSVPGPYTGNATFAFEEYKACKDPNKGIMENVQITECQARCASWPTCGAYTYNHVHNKCYMKETCYDIRSDDGHTDLSGIKSGRPGLELMAMHPAWVRRHTHLTSETSPAGGAFIAFHLTYPQVVSCMRFVLPPDNATAFPDAGNIEYSTDGGQIWHPVAQLNNVNAQSASTPVKVLSVYPSVHVVPRDGASPASPVVTAVRSEVQDAPSAPQQHGKAGVVAAVVASVILGVAGFVAGIVALTVYNRRQAAAREAYERRFQAVFDNPDFEELDRIVEQDQDSFLQALNPANWRTPWAGKIHSPFPSAS